MRRCLSLWVRVSLLLAVGVAACSALACGQSVGASGSGCRATSDCGQSTTGVGEACVGPNENVGCLCDEAKACAHDSQCGSGKVCRNDPTVLPGCIEGSGNQVCAAPCASDSDCAATDTCDGGHCLPRTCEQCPSYFSCASGACVIPTCSSDGDCTGGYCVNGSCAGTLGMCQTQCV